LFAAVEQIPVIELSAVFKDGIHAVFLKVQQNFRDDPRRFEIIIKGPMAACLMVFMGSEAIN
jgi:hypothetical protein